MSMSSNPFLAKTYYRAAMRRFRHKPHCIRRMTHAQAECERHRQAGHPFQRWLWNRDWPERFRKRLAQQEATAKGDVVDTIL
jgi:hypothetical protein